MNANEEYNHASVEAARDEIYLLLRPSFGEERSMERAGNIAQALSNSDLTMRESVDGVIEMIAPLIPPHVRGSAHRLACEIVREWCLWACRPV